MDAFPTRRTYLAVEGGAVELAERGALFYVIIDETCLVDLLSEEDSMGIVPITVWEFETEQERSEYLEKRFGHSRDAARGFRQ